MTTTEQTMAPEQTGSDLLAAARRRTEVELWAVDLVQCPHCWAPAGTMCVGPDGEPDPGRIAHVRRVRRASKAALGECPTGAIHE